MIEVCPLMQVTVFPANAVGGGEATAEEEGTDSETVAEDGRNAPVCSWHSMWP